MTKAVATSLMTSILALVSMTLLGTIRTYAAATLLPPGEQCFQSTSPTSGGLYGPLSVLGTVSAGSGYNNNVYTNVPLTGGSGFGATANITVVTNVVTNVTIINPGSHYAGGDTLSAATATLGSAGSGFSVPVSSVATTGTGMLGLLGAITGGSGGAPGVYPGVSLTGGSGSGAAANITVSGGAVTAVAITNPGLQYQVADTLSAASGSIGGVTGFSVSVSSVTVNSALAGGQVFMYVPNTVTTKQTWRNATQTILNTNPITLDQNGCAVIYGTGSYRQILQDSLGNTVWDQITTDTSAQQNVFWAGLAGGTPNAITLTDPGFNATDGTIINFTALSSNTGSTTIDPSGFGTFNVVKDTSAGPQSLTGGEIVANNPISVIYRQLDVSFHILNPIISANPLQCNGATCQVTVLHSKDVGAIGNGTTDDTAALQGWVNSCQTNKLICFLDAGTYKTTTQLNVSSSITIEGVNLKLSILSPASGINAINVSSAGAVTFRDFSIVYTNPAASGTAGIVVTAPAATENNSSRFSNLSIQQHYIGISFIAASSWVVDSSAFFNATSSNSIGIQVQNTNNSNSGDNTIISSSIECINSCIGINYNSSGGLRIINNKIVGGTAGGMLNGIQLSLSPAISIGDLIISGNSIENYSAVGIAMQRSGSSGQFDNVNITGNEFAQNVTGASAINVLLDAVGPWLSNLNITGNIWRGPGSGTNNIFLALNSTASFNVSGNQLFGGAGTNVGYSIGVSASRGVVDAGSFDLSVSPFQSNSTNTVLVNRQGQAFASLPAAAQDGSQILITDGTTGSPCTGAGNGSNAFRQNGAWKCF